jgi:hypothetical protein
MPEFANNQSFLRRVAGFRYAVNLSFTLKGEIMIGKPDWLRGLEEEQSAKLIAENNAKEISASHKKILDTEIGSLWIDVRRNLQEIAQGAELHGVRFATKPEGVNALVITADGIGANKTIVGSRTMMVWVSPEEYKFHVMENGRPSGPVVFVSVSDGKLAISDGLNEPIRYDEKRYSMADAICRKLLEQFFRDLAGSSGSSAWNRL